MTVNLMHAEDFYYPMVVGLVVVLGAYMSSYVHIDKKKDIIIPGKGPTQGLDDTKLTSEKEYSINFTEQHKKFCLGLHYNGINSGIFVNRVEI